jgi:membrane protein implicated in regulation of membrane protease activity
MRAECRFVASVFVHYCPGAASRAHLQVFLAHALLLAVPVVQLLFAARYLRSLRKQQQQQQRRQRHTEEMGWWTLCGVDPHGASDQ